MIPGKLLPDPLLVIADLIKFIASKSLYMRNSSAFARRVHPTVLTQTRLHTVADSKSYSLSIPISSMVWMGVEYNVICDDVLTHSRRNPLKQELKP